MTFDEMCGEQFAGTTRVAGVFRDAQGRKIALIGTRLGHEMAAAFSATAPPQERAATEERGKCPSCGRPFTHCDLAMEEANDGWMEECKRIEGERDTARARIEQMEDALRHLTQKVAGSAIVEHWSHTADEGVPYLRCPRCLIDACLHPRQEVRQEGSE